MQPSDLDLVGAPLPSKRKRKDIKGEQKARSLCATMAPRIWKFLDTKEQVRELAAYLLSEVERKQANAGKNGGCDGRSKHELVRIAVDCEGVALGREGELSILILATTTCVYLVDVTTLGNDALLDKPEAGKAAVDLKTVLEHPSILKLMFDCRSDADVLYAHFEIHLKNVCDLQYSAVEKWCTNKTYLIGLKKSMAKLGVFDEADHRSKEAGLKYFAPDCGGSSENWKLRPLPEVLKSYCVVDVKYFFVLFERTPEFRHGAIRAASKRLKRVQSPHYQRPDSAIADCLSEE